PNPRRASCQFYTVESQANADMGNGKRFFGTGFDCLKPAKTRAEKSPPDVCPPSVDKHTLITDCGAMQFIDTVGLSMLKDTHHDYKEIGVQVLLANCNPSTVTPPLAFHSVHDAVQFAEQWYRAAREQGEKGCAPGPRRPACPDIFVDLCVRNDF
uniref:STAS domain-containing protein n=1 Tax=Anser brachyrhynchus TaxID=132585 RepID=A0A8B9BA88_9AVES